MCKQTKKDFMQEWNNLEKWVNAVTIVEGIKLLKESNCEDGDIVCDFLLPSVGGPLIELLRCAGYNDRQMIEKIEEVSRNYID